MKPPIVTHIPGQAPIELVAYYDEFVSYYPKCELATKDWFVRHVGDDWVMLDCGANIGYFSILFARLARHGRVFAFEPTSTIEMMRANLAHHRADNVTPLPLALGKESGQRTDAIYRIWGNEAERQAYAFTTIDDFVAAQSLSRVDCIKIDVDSFDFEVLQGAEQTLRRFNPYVMVELNHALSKRNQSNTEALEWMAQRGYPESVVLDYDNFLFKRPARVSSPRKQITLNFDSAAELAPAPNLTFPASPVPVVSVDELHTRLGLAQPIAYPSSSRAKPLTAWLMEDDDSPIFRYLYRQLLPKRHLEFGTWRGAGTLYCLEESNATVWTLNLPFGENAGYSYRPGEREAMQAWAAKLGLPAQETYPTDSLGFVGQFYLERGLGHRVCQIYADSQQWDIANFPPGFFDTVLIDGGHTREVVLNDTQKALPLVRPGGVVLWHDFCPPVYNECESTRGVLDAIVQNLDWLTTHTEQLFWIYPSWILLGVRNTAAFTPLPTAAPPIHLTANTPPSPIPAPSPPNQIAALCARIGRMLERPGPISLEEMQAGAETLGALLSAPDIIAHAAALPRPFPAAMLPLLTINIETALNDGNGQLGLALTQLREFLQSPL